MSAARTFRSSQFGAPGITTQSLGIPAAAYPGRIATNSDLIVAVDRQQTTLLLPMTASATSMTVLDPSMMAAYSLLSIDNEIVKTTGPAAGNVIPISRGFDGTTAATHLTGALVSGLVDAYHHNALVSEIEAIETALGPNLSNIAAGGQRQLLICTDYIFTPLQPGIALTGGSLNVVTISPVPQGVNGTNTLHQLYITGGTGAAEVVTISGGTAVSGAASGTIIFQPANNHTGAWQIQTATAGIQEALWKGGQGATVWVPGASPGQLVYGTISFPYINQTVTGMGPGSAVNKMLPTGDMFSIPYGINNVEISNMMFIGQGAAGSHTSGAMIIADRCALAIIRNIRIYNCWNGIDTLGAATSATGLIEMSDIFIQEAKNIGMNLALGIYSNLIINNTIAGQIGVAHVCGDGTVMTNIVIGGPFSYMLYIAPTGTQRVDNILISNLQIDSWKQYGIYFGGNVVGGVRAVNISNVHIANQVPDASNNAAITFNSGPQHIHFTGGRIFLNQKQAAVVTLGAVDVQFMGIDFLSNARSGGVPVIDVQAAIARFSLVGNTFGIYPSIESVSHATYCVSFSGAGSADLTITGNILLDFLTGPLLLAAAPGVGTVITSNSCVDDVAPTVASAATVTFPPNPRFFLSGSTPVTAVAGLWEGAAGQFIATSATPGAWTAGATIANTLTPVINVPVVWSFYSGKIWLK